MDSEIKRIEEMSMNAHPSLNTVYYDGWYLRFAGGYTNRANSVNILNSSMFSFTDKIRYCEDRYTRQNLPTVFKITPLSLDLDRVLAESNYSIVTKTNIMVMDIPQMNTNRLSSVVTSHINENWQSNYFRLNGLSDVSIAWAKKIHSNIMNQTLCATLCYHDEIVACGLCVIENDYAGLYDIIVCEQHRCKGYGRDICASLISKAATYGAKKAYLQVVDSNTNAKELYKKLGFVDKYQYWYRVKDLS